jgi:hypothetical protein
VLAFTLAVFMAAQMAEDTAVMTMALPPTLLELDGAVCRLYFDIVSLLSNHGDTAGGAQDADSAVRWQFILRTHFALSLTHRRCFKCDLGHSANAGAG